MLRAANLSREIDAFGAPDRQRCLAWDSTAKNVAHASTDRREHLPSLRVARPSVHCPVRDWPSTSLSPPAARGSINIVVQIRSDARSHSPSSIILRSDCDTVCRRQQPQESIREENHQRCQICGKIMKLRKQGAGLTTPSDVTARTRKR